MPSTCLGSGLRPGVKSSYEPFCLADKREEANADRAVVAARLRAVERAVAGGWDRAVAGWDRADRAVEGWRADRTVERWSERAVDNRAVDGATSIGALETCVGCGARAP